jgi:hypothetical protein
MTKYLQDAEIKPQFRLVSVQEDGWNEGLLQRCGGKIWTVYLYDYRRHTHLCELTPSYECHYVESYPDLHLDDDEEREELQDLLDEARADGCSNVDYYHCTGIDHIPYPSHRHRLVADYDTAPCDDMTYEDALEETLEYVRCNGGLYAGDTELPV